ncbi:MAG: hypothetical protein E7319_11200 [Clostridiales bacterium]|nr:hypothetical protein [Clostridiales bacterium]
MRSEDLSFGFLVKQYILAHELSYQALVDRLGYKSKTSIARIIQNATSYELRLDFYQRFSSQYVLTTEERKSFEHYLNLSRLDVRQQKLFLAFRRLFSFQHPEAAVHCLPYDEHEQTTELDLLLRQYGQQAVHVSVFLGGSCLPLIRRLYQSLNRMNLPFHFQHFLFAEESPSHLVDVLADAVPLLFDSRYLLYTIKSNDYAARVDNLCLVRFERKDGTGDDSLLMLLQDQSHLLYLSHVTGHLYDAVLRLIEDLDASPLKTTEPLEEDFSRVLAFLQKQQYYLQLEENQALYFYCKDLDCALVPPDIFKNALLQTVFPDHEAKSLCKELCDLQARRYQNLLKKHSPSHIILTREFLKNFLQSGRFQDHPFLLRTFTLSERVDIVNGILSLQANNPFFFVRLAADNIPHLWNLVSVRCSRRMVRASSHADTSQNDTLLLQPATSKPNVSSMIELTQPELVPSFAAFYLDELWNRYTLPSKRSIAMIHSVLQYHVPRPNA